MSANTVKVTTPYLFEYLAMSESEQKRWSYIMKHCSYINPHAQTRDVLIDADHYALAMRMH